MINAIAVIVILIVLGLYVYLKFGTTQEKDAADGKPQAKKNSEDVYYSRVRRIEMNERRARRHAAAYQQSQLYKKVVLNGNQYDRICRKFQKEFEFALGPQWKERLDIPPKPTYYIPGTRKKETNHDIDNPNNHTYWVYHLLLADEGKIDEQVISTVFGLRVGSPESAYMNMKFVQCIENLLMERGVKCTRFVFTQLPNNLHIHTFDTYSMLQSIAYGKFIIQGTEFDPATTARLWGKHSVLRNPRVPSRKR